MLYNASAICLIPPLITRNQMDVLVQHPLKIWQFNASALELTNKLQQAKFWAEIKAKYSMSLRVDASANDQPNIFQLAYHNSTTIYNPDFDVASKLSFFFYKTKYQLVKSKLLETLILTIHHSTDAFNQLFSSIFIFISFTFNFCAISTHTFQP